MIEETDINEEFDLESDDFNLKNIEQNNKRVLLD